MVDDSKPENGNKVEKVGTKDLSKEPSNEAKKRLSLGINKSKDQEVQPSKTSADTQPSADSPTDYVSDEEIIEKMNLDTIKLFVSTVPEFHDNLVLIKRIRKNNRKARIIVNSSDIDEALRLYKAGADYVVMPHFLGGEHASRLITDIRKRKIKIRKIYLNNFIHRYFIYMTI